MSTYAITGVVTLRVFNMKITIEIKLDLSIEQKIDLYNRFVDVIVGEFNVPVDDYDIKIDNEK